MQAKLLGALSPVALLFAVPLVLTGGCASLMATHFPRGPATTASPRARHPDVNGSWSPLVRLKDRSNLFPGDHERPRPGDGWWVTPIQASLLADGDVLITGWSRTQETYCEAHKGRQNGTSFVISPGQLDRDEAATIGIEPIAENPKDKRDVLYCAGHAPFPDGRILFMGGARYDFLDIAGKELEYGINYGRVFDPHEKKFTVVASTSPAGPHPTDAQLKTDWSWYEQGMMWYPTNTRLPDGKQLIAGGFAQQNGPFEPEFPNKSLAIFDTVKFDRGANPWTVLIDHDVASDAMNIGPFDYPHSYLLYAPVTVDGVKRLVATWGGKNGQLAFVSLDPQVPEAKRMATPVNGRRPQGASAADKTSLLLPDGRIFVMGGGANGERETQRIDLYDPKRDSWQSLDTGISRIRPASTLLPDGKVLVLNGEGLWDGGGKTVGDRRRPTIFDPETNTVENLEPWTDDEGDRGYHNISLLLKDGRVLVGGGRTLVKKDGVEEFRIGCERPDLRIFSPPYLFKGPRPVVRDLHEGQRLELGQEKFMFSFEGPAPRRKHGVVLLATGAETHHFDQNQRFVAVDFRVVGNRIIATTPATAYTAPEGDYILYLITTDGVPSVGRHVRIVSR